MKALLHLSIDTEVLSLIKSKDINLSALIENIFRNELKLKNTTDPTEDLKLLNAKLATECNELRTKLELKEKELTEWKEKNKPKTYRPMFQK